MTVTKKVTLTVAGLVVVAGLIRALTTTTEPVAGQKVAASGPAEFGFAGSASCSARGCHGKDDPLADAAVSLRNEYTFTLLHDKHTQSYAILLQPRAQTIARNLARGDEKAYVPAHEDWRCLACHATPQSAWEQSLDEPGKVKADQDTANWQLGGISCEACHGPASGGPAKKSSWLTVHTAEKEWRARKNKDLPPVERQKQYDFTNLADYAVQGRMCAGCHVGAPPDKDHKIPARDCNHDIMAAGHPRLNFELSIFRANLPAHWKPKPNEDTKDIWLKGRISSAQLSLELLHHRAETAEKTSRWPEFAEYRCYACHQTFNTDWRSASSNAARNLGSFPYDPWYGAFLPALNPDLREGYQKLTELMAKPSWVGDKPQVKEVMDLTKALARKLEKWPDNIKAADALSLPRIHEAIKSNPPRTWEDAMQLTLALAAYNRKDFGKDPPPGFILALQKMAKSMAFPVRKGNPDEKILAEIGEGPDGLKFPEALKTLKSAYQEFLKP